MNAELTNQFVDTNVLVYAHDVSAGIKKERAQRVLRDLWQSGNGCLSIQVLQEFFVTITHKVARPMTIETAVQLINDLRTWHIHVPDVDDVLAAITLQEQYRISFWDALIVNSAYRLGCGLIWSEDLNAGQLYQGVRVLNPLGDENG